jgi:beta-glucosidase
MGRFPGDFLLGTATAGLQVEGGIGASSWHRWADRGHVKDATHPSRANDHWRRVREDVELLQELGCHTHRLGIEWYRIEPEEGRFDREALDHYREELALLRRAGIVPLVTLHHFTNPLWLEDDGGWLDPRITARFERYVRHVVGELSDLVTDWVTINEPNVYLYSGFITGEWPPGHSSIVDYLRGTTLMVGAHRAAYQAIHEVARERDAPARVGVAHHLRVFDSAGGVMTNAIARAIERRFQGVFLDAMTGRTGGTRWSDFLGINYYTRDIVRAAWNPGSLFSRLEVAPRAATNDLGWEIYPAGLSRLVSRCFKRYGLPIWITENGTCDARDAFRAAYLREHLRELVRLLADGVPVQRYYHWTLMDNFEWVEGESARFGLYECDFETQERRIRPSGELYREICASRRIPPGEI